MAWQRWRRDGRQNPPTTTSNKRVSLVRSTLLHSDIWALELFNRAFNNLLIVLWSSTQAFSAPVSCHTVLSVSLSYLSSSVFSVCLFMLSRFFIGIDSVAVHWIRYFPSTLLHNWFSLCEKSSLRASQLLSDFWLDIWSALSSYSIRCRQRTQTDI